MPVPFGHVYFTGGSFTSMAPKKSPFTSNSEINYLSSLKYKKYILKG
jgi:hypothetical protein